MGDFEFHITLDEGEGLDMPPPEPMTVVPDHIEQLVDEDSLKSGIQLIDDEALTGDADFQAALFGGPSKDNAAEEKKKRADIQLNPFAAVPTKAQQTNTNAAE